MDVLSFPSFFVTGSRGCAGKQRTHWSSGTSSECSLTIWSSTQLQLPLHSTQKGYLLLQRIFLSNSCVCSLVPRLHCPAFFALWKNTGCQYFSKVQKNAGQWSLGTRLICLFKTSDTAPHKLKKKLCVICPPVSSLFAVFLQGFQGDFGVPGTPGGLVGNAAVVWCYVALCLFFLLINLGSSRSNWCSGHSGRKRGSGK